MAQHFFARRASLFLAGLLVMLCAIVAIDAWRHHLLSGFEQAAEAPPTAGLTEQAIIHCHIFYPLCGHSVEAEPESIRSLRSLTEEKLAALGWQLVWQEGEAYLSREQEGFCPTDSQKRHLALAREHLGVYEGPLGGGGGLLQQLDIPLQAIPARWLAQLTNGGIEFGNEEALFMALDNLDELVKEWREVMAEPVR